MNSGGERAVKGKSQVRRGESEGSGGGGSTSGKQRQEGTGYTVSLKSLRGSGGRGRDERRG